MNFASTGTLKGQSNALELVGAIKAIYYWGINGDESKFADSTATMYLWTEKDYAALEAAGEALTKENASYTVEDDTLVNSGYGYEYEFASEQFVAKRLGETLYGVMCVTDSDGVEHCTGVTTYSPEAYASKKLNDGKTAQIDEMVKWMVVYGERAKIYFEN